MKNIETTLNKLAESANSEQTERIGYLLQAITNLENKDSDAAAAFVKLADSDNNYNIITADELAEMVRGMDNLPFMIQMIGDLKDFAWYFRLDGYGWAVDIEADDLAIYIEELAEELADEIN